MNAAGDSIEMLRQASRRKRCRSPDTITSALPSAAASRTRLSAGSARTSLIVAVGEPPGLAGLGRPADDAHTLRGHSPSTSQPVRPGGVLPIAEIRRNLDQSS